MNHEAQLNKDILNITLRINREFPELAKYVGEMPVTIPNTENPEINIENLKKYKESLTSLIKKYTDNQINKKK